MKTLPNNLDTLLDDLDYLKTEQYYRVGATDGKEWEDIESPLTAISTACTNDLVSKSENCGAKTYGTDCFKVSDNTVSTKMSCAAKTAEIANVLTWANKKNAMVGLKSL